MSDTRPGHGQAEERLPWLESPRRPASAPKRPASAKAKPAPRRRAAGPIFVLLSLFLLAGIGMIAFLAGRGSVSLSPSAAEQQASGGRATMTVPPPVAPAAPAAAVETAPAPAATRGSVSPPREAPTSRIVSPKARTPRISARTVARIKRRRAPAAAAPVPAPMRDIVWQPTVAPALPGRVIQLGIYSDPQQADAAFRRIAAVYPYLARRPRVVALDRPVPGQPVRYRLQLGARTKSDARRLCRNLLSIGRGCTVVPSPAVLTTQPPGK